MIWFTSDTHFGHKNIIRLCGRPYSSVEEMNESLINNWNECVKPDDTIYHLGDFSFGGTEFTKNIISRLNGYKVLIRGNHDRSPQRYIDWGFNEAYEYLVREYENENIWMDHIPEEKGDDDRKLVRHSYKEAFHAIHPNVRPMKKYVPTLVLCGHAHNKWWLKDRCINVGVDVWGYKPVSLPELIKIRDDMRLDK